MHQQEGLNNLQHPEELEKQTERRTTKLRELKTQLQQEITRRKQVESALRHSEERFKAQYTGMPVPTYTWQMQDDDLVLIDYNAAAGAITHDCIRKALGVPLSTMYADDPEIMADMLSCYRTGATIQKEMNYALRTTGEKKVFNVRYVAIPPDLVLVHTEDITAHRRTEQRLEALSQLSASLFHPGSLHEKLNRITDGIINIFQADFARIWLAKPGDLCADGCCYADSSHKRPRCKFRERCLHLVVSSGRYTHINGMLHRRIPLGLCKIGRIATGVDVKFLTDDVPHAPMVHDHAWAEELGLVGFAGYRLLSENKEPLGVLALFSQQAISSDENIVLEGLAVTTSQMIQSSQAEAALAESEDRYKRLVEGSPDILYTFSNARGGLYCSQRVEEILGYSPEHLKEHPMLWADSIHPDDRQRVQQAIEGLRQGRHFAIEYRIKNARGEWLWLYDRSIGSREHKRELVIEGLASDMTERKRTEVALRQAHQNWQNIFEAIGHPTVILDTDHTILEANKAVITHTGKSADQLKGMKCYDVFHQTGKLGEADGCPLRRMLTSGNLETVEMEMEAFNGTYLVSCTPVFDETGQVKRIIHIATDISDRKHAEEQLQHYADELRAANAELSEYAYAVSHDLKAPLRAIRNYADFLREDLEGTLEEEQQAYFTHLTSAVSEADALIHDILELSRIGRQEAVWATVDLHEFFTDMIASLHFPQNIVIDLQDHWPTLMTCLPLLRQIFQNLLNNAEKFNTAETKRINVGWTSAGSDSYAIFVRDNGIGIDSQYTEAIFRIFRRLHTKTEFEGTGVGLAIVKRAVSKLGGTIRVESEPGCGSTFWVTLPILRDAHA